MNIRTKIDNGEYNISNSVWDTYNEIRDETEQAKYRLFTINPLQESLDDNFKVDLFDYLGISNHPKREKLFKLAWEHGHGSGLRDVVFYAEDFVELLK